MREFTDLSRKPVLIIGAGISGLATARLLTQHCIPNVVFEASSADRNQGFSITLRKWAYEPLLHELGDISTETLAKAIAPDRHVGGAGSLDQALRDVSSGQKLIAPEPAKDGTSDRKMFRANRNALRVWLRDCGEQEVDVRYRHKLKSFQGELGNLKVEFENGVNFEGSLIIAADGVHSTVRQHMLAHINPEIVPVVVFHGDFHLSHEEFNTIIKPSIGDSNILGGVGDSFNTPITVSNINEKGVDLDWSYSRAVRGDNDPLFNPYGTQDQLRQIPNDLLYELESAKLASPFSYVLSAEHIQKNGLFNWVSRSVFVSRSDLNSALEQGVVFVGDSWHAMPIFGGEGGNHALLDTVELSKALLDNSFQGGRKMENEEKGHLLEARLHNYYDGAYKRCHDAVRRCRQRFGLLHRPIEEWRMLAEQKSQQPT
ncbi:putative FAD-dependent monooxygenase [Glonium stellatum]|uniref:Putative FAD-dependent monooxygenase n=1 Tax=Glonium stellatum TaxID=574774 RepID=A0A8E2F1R9_9PEZI|nr:putative FAD-dependent monooxygenase [Glonium stellatum]